MKIKKLKGHNNRLAIKIIESEKKEDSLLFVPENFSEEDRHVVCQFLDPLVGATHCLAEKHLVEVVKIYDESYTFISNHAIVCTWEEGKK
jgi:hypothetical protein